MPIEYRFGNELALDQMIDLYHASTLGERLRSMIGEPWRRCFHTPT